MHVSRALVAAPVAVLGLLAAGCSEPETAPPFPAPVRPNLLLISIDTLRADALGAYGQERATSPAIDALAADGTLFTRALAPAPKTLPSHASLHTGQQPFRHGVRSNFGYALGEERTTLAEVLAEHGFVTAAEIAAPVLGRRTGIAQGFSSFRDSDSLDATRKQALSNGEPFDLDERDAVDVTRHALDFLKRHRQQRFFLWLHYFDPHAFYLPPPPFDDRFPDSAYHAEVAFVDHYVGLLLRALDGLELADHTLVVVTSDHGEGLGEHGEATHSFFVYRSTMRVPLILRGPGVPSGTTVPALVRLADVAPTLLDLLGLPPLREADGVSLVGLLADPANDPGLLGYGESSEPHTSFGASTLRFVQSGRFKYIHKTEPQLFDVEADPGEQSNLAELRPELLRELLAELERLLAAAPADAQAASSLDPQIVARLGALGYVPSESAANGDGLDSLAVTGPDPTRLIGDFTTLTDAWSRLRQGRADEALADFEALGARFPDRFAIAYGHIEALEALEREDEALPLLRRQVARGSRHLPFHLDLARLEAEAGRVGAAERILGDAARILPCDPRPRIALAQLLAAEQRHDEQLDVLAEGYSACPGSFELANDFAYALSTTTLDEWRDGARALAIARSAVAATGGAHPGVLDTLACALAETGDLAAARRHGARALELVRAMEQPESVVAVFRAHLEAFEAGRPVRE